MAKLTAIPANAPTGATFRSLWDFACAHTAPDAKPGHNYTLLDAGLALHNPLSRGLGYSCDPENLLVFATTGGDGVHYGLLSDTEPGSDDQPVVMVLPMNFDAPHLIVGANLREFLDLGCCFGYFSLEGLVYHRDKTCRAIVEATVDGSDQGDAESDLLDSFRTELGLKPWKEVSRRLGKLNAQFLPRLRLPKQGA